MLVSIVTPLFNSEQFIYETILSVKRQTFENWEWLFVDGGSKDKSMDIVKSFALEDDRIKLIINQDDKGPAHARYTGIKQATGKYIAFLDADDIWHPNKLEKQIGEMESRNLDFTYTLCRELQKDNNYASIILPTSNSFTYKQYLKKRGIYALTVVIKKELLTDDIISIWNKDSYDDTLWWILVMKKGIKATLIPYDLALYRLSENQLSSRRGYTIKRVYSIYNYFDEISWIKKNIYFVNYFLNSAFRHFQLKLFPKIKVSDLTYQQQQQLI